MGEFCNMKTGPGVPDRDGRGGPPCLPPPEPLLAPGYTDCPFVEEVYVDEVATRARIRSPHLCYGTHPIYDRGVSLNGGEMALGGYTLLI